MDLNLYTKYYYKIKALDNGGLVSAPSVEVSDEIYSIPNIISPSNGSDTSYFARFIITAIDKPAIRFIYLLTLIIFTLTDFIIGE